NSVAYRKNQNCFPVKLCVIMEDKEEQVGICIAIDISMQVEAILELEKAKEAAGLALQIRNEFVSNVTHELRTPVNGIKGITGALYETELTEEQKKLLGIIERCCSNMSNIINDLLDFSKLESGKFSLEIRKFNFREFMNKAVEVSIPLMNERGLSLRISVTPDLPEFLRGDELRLTQIINNLLSNSIKFTKVGQISIEVTKTEEKNGEIELFFMVIDTGIGIEKENLEKLFKSFSQVDATITRKYGGTGLGLSITKQLVELMKGSIFVESERGKGSTFSFSVKLRRVDSDQKDLHQEPRDTGEFHFKFPNNQVNMENVNRAFQFGTEENRNEINKNMEKLILCIEMDNWEKAEEFAKIIKTLVGDKRKELSRDVFRLELAIRKEAKEKSKVLYEILEKAIGENQDAN
ncbi:MAG: ATP-binding protein, partial [Acetivibrio sp.]